MDRSCADNDLAAVRNTARNQALITTFEPDSPSIHHQRVAALDPDNVLIGVVNMGSRPSSLAASPERHQAAVDTVENLANHTRCRLIRGRDFLGRMLPEFKELARECPFSHLPKGPVYGRAGGARRE